MKYIMAQPSVPRFEWEVQVAVYQMLNIGISKEDIIVLFTRHDDNVSNAIKELGVQVYVYDDYREDMGYIPSVKPYLMYRYLDEDKEREKETYFFMDSDVIIRELPKTINERDSKVWYGSNCNGYLSYDYIKQCRNGQEILNKMADIIGITVEDIKSINENCIGAQYVIIQPTSEYFEKVYKDSITLYYKLKVIDSNFQIWAVEMNSTLLNMLYFGIKPKVSEDLDFTWATDPVEKWYDNKIFHNAGINPDMTDSFHKGSYIDKSPFDDDLSFVNREKATFKYAQLVNETRDWLRG